MIEQKRLNTKEVLIGNLPLGGKNPVRIQSMTNTATDDVEQTVKQAKAIFDAGASFVRITAPSMRSVEMIKTIKSLLVNEGYHFPLVADVHFFSEVAIAIAPFVEKVRINPGNFASSNNKLSADYDELQAIQSKLSALISVCKTHNTALRIGTNHGSLSHRILDKYGDTPEGMVEATMEFLRICVSENFFNVVVSLKASNSRIMIYANRLLVSKMLAETMNFPVHLGVTEAGFGEDGRIKSSVGIGTLLAEGIGDTIRVSLTESPEKEIPVAEIIVNLFSENKKISFVDSLHFHESAFHYHKNETNNVRNIGAKNVPVVIANYSFSEKYITLLPDFYFVRNVADVPKLNENQNIILNFHDWKSSKPKQCFPVYTLDNLKTKLRHPEMNFLLLNLNELSQILIGNQSVENNFVFIIQLTDFDFPENIKKICNELKFRNINNPIIFKKSYNENNLTHFQIKTSCDLGTYFIDGFGDGLWLKNTKQIIKNEEVISTSFGILQACRVRMSKTEYISCPSCGRTFFDIEKVTANIQKVTSHLKSLKIAVMGCIVNGPGEMSDADYGYVGSGKGKITLYKSTQAVKRNIPEQFAVDELVQLIKESGDWIKPE